MKRSVMGYEVVVAVTDGKLNFGKWEQIFYGELCINLKCDPFESDFLRQAFTDLTPAYHMNKTHWNTVTLNGDVPKDELHRMIEKSYDLIKPKVKVWKYEL